MSLDQLPDLQALYEMAHDFAAKCHQGQVRKGSGLPYITHPEAVAANFDLKQQPIEKLAAILHDTIEDAGATKDDIVALAGGDDKAKALMVEVADVVELLSHGHSPRNATPEEKREFYRDCLRCAATNPHSRAVKRADLLNNISTINELDEPVRTKLSFKYEGAIEILDSY